MHLRSTNLKELAQKEGRGNTINKTLIFSNLSTKELQSISHKVFTSLDKTNYTTELELTQIGNEDDDPNELQFEVCTKMSFDNVPKDRIPLEGANLSAFGSRSDQYDNFMKELNSIDKSTDLFPEEPEGFLGKFFSGILTIEPTDTKPKKFMVDIQGCNIYNNMWKGYDQDIDDVHVLFRNTISTKVEFQNTIKPTKHMRALEDKLLSIKTKLPAALFHNFPKDEYKGHSQKESVFIASMKDNAIFELEDTDDIV